MDRRSLNPKIARRAFLRIELALELASRQTTRRGSVFRTHEYQRRSSSLKVWYLDSPSRPETTGTPFAADVFLVLHVSRRHRKGISCHEGDRDPCHRRRHSFKTAKAAGITIPESFILRADEVIGERRRDTQRRPILQNRQT